MKAVILAAGMGTRLRPLTYETPKCLVRVNGTPILEYALLHLGSVGIGTAVIVVGHLAHKVREYFGAQYRGVRLVYVENPAFDKTNNMYSLWLAREYLDEDVLLLEGDVLFELEVVERVCKLDHPNIIVVDDYRDFMDGSGVDTEDGIVTEMVLKHERCHTATHRPGLKTVNIYRLSGWFLQQHLGPAIEEHIEKGDSGEFYERAIGELIGSNAVKMQALSVSDLRWFEIDTQEDLQTAEGLFGRGRDRGE